MFFRSLLNKSSESFQKMRNLFDNKNLKEVDTQSEEKLGDTNETLTERHTLIVTYIQL